MMAAPYQQPGSREWMWYQQMQMRMNHGGNDNSGAPAPADYQAFNLRPPGERQRQPRPGFVGNPSQPRMRGPPPYYMMNQTMVRGNSLGGGMSPMMNPRMYQPSLIDNRIRGSALEGLQEMVKGQKRQSPAHQHVSPVNQHLSMDTRPRGPSPVSYLPMQTSQSHPMSNQCPPVRGHPNNIPQYFPHQGMVMNNLPMRNPPPLISQDGSIVPPSEHYPNQNRSWEMTRVGQTGNAGFSPRLPYSFSSFPHQNVVPSSHITKSAMNLQQVADQSMSINCTNMQQIANLTSAPEKKSISPSCGDTLSNSIFGRWYKPPTTEEEVKYDYILDDDDCLSSNSQDNATESQLDLKSDSCIIKRPSKVNAEKKEKQTKRLEGQISRIMNTCHLRLSPINSAMGEIRTGLESESDTIPGGNVEVSCTNSPECGNQVLETVSSSGLGISSTPIMTVHSSMHNSTVNRIMPPLIQAPTALVQVSTRHANQSPLSGSVTTSQTSPLIQSSNVSVSQSSALEENIRIVDSYSLNHQNFIHDIVIQPKEMENVVNPLSGKLNSDTASEKTEMKKKRKRKSSGHDSDFSAHKKITPLRIRLPFSTKSRLKEKLSEAVSHDKGDHEKGLKPQCNVTNKLKAVQRVEPFVHSKDKESCNSTVTETVFSSQNLKEKQDSVEVLPCDKDIINNNEEKVVSESNKDKCDCASKQEKTGVCDCASKQEKTGVSDSERLKEVVSKISLGQKRRKSAVLLSPPLPPGSLTPDGIHDKTSREVTNVLHSASQNTVETANIEDERISNAAASGDVDKPVEGNSGQCCDKPGDHLEKDTSTKHDDDLPKLTRSPKRRRIRLTRKPYRKDNDSETEEDSLKVVSDKCEEKNSGKDVPNNDSSVQMNKTPQIKSRKIRATQKSAQKSSSKADSGSDTEDVSQKVKTRKRARQLSNRQNSDDLLEMNTNNNNNNNQCDILDSAKTLPCSADRDLSDRSTDTVTRSSSSKLMETKEHTDSPITVSSEDLEDITEVCVRGFEETIITVNTKTYFDINKIDTTFFYVMFHGSKLLCLSYMTGKYFVVRELLHKCFADIAEKNRKKGVYVSRVFKQVYVAKERDLNIPYMELPEHMRANIANYLMKECLTGKNILSHIGIIHVNDAKRLYHFFFGVKSCHDLKCVLPWSPDNSKDTTKPLQEGCVTHEDGSGCKKGNKDKQNMEVEETTNNVVDQEAESEVEIISCQVIYDQEMEEETSTKGRPRESGNTSSAADKENSNEPESQLKKPTVSPKKKARPTKETTPRKMTLRRRQERIANFKRSGKDKGYLTDDSDATIPYVEETESDTDFETRKNSSLSDQSVGESSLQVDTSLEKLDTSSEKPCLDKDNRSVCSNNNLVEGSNDDELEETREDPDENEDYVVKGGIAELYGGMFRFLVINGRKFFPFEDLCQHYDKDDLISCLKAKPGHYKAIRCSVVETEFLNNLEPSLPMLEESATIIEEDLLHVVAQLNFKNLFDNNVPEVVDLTEDGDAVVPQRVASTPIKSPDQSPAPVDDKTEAFESFDEVGIDTSDDILLMELGTCSTRDAGKVAAVKDEKFQDVIGNQNQTALADALRDIWEQSNSLKTRLATMNEEMEDMKKGTLDFEATCQQYGDAIDFMTKAIQNCSDKDKSS